MEYVAPLDPAQLSVLLAASVAITQIVRDAWVALGGKAGEWLKVVCIGVAALLGSVMIFAPELWAALTAPLIGAIGTGGVSFVKDLRSSGNKPDGE